MDFQIVFFKLKPKAIKDKAYKSDEYKYNSNQKVGKTIALLAKRNSNHSEKIYAAKTQLPHQKNKNAVKQSLSP